MAEAQQAIAEANSLSVKSSDVGTHLVFEIDSAYVLAAAKDFSGAERFAKSALTEAKELGFVLTRFEASLALGKIQMMGRNPASGRVLLRQLTKDARAKGFVFIAREALAAN